MTKAYFFHFFRFIFLFSFFFMFEWLNILILHFPLLVNVRTKSFCFYTFSLSYVNQFILKDFSTLLFFEWNHTHTKEKTKQNERRKKNAAGFLILLPRALIELVTLKPLGTFLFYFSSSFFSGMLFISV